MGNIHGLLQGNLPESTHFLHTPGSIFQYRMDISAKFSGIHGNLLPFPGPQTVFQEIGKTAFRKPVDLGGGQI